MKCVSLFSLVAMLLVVSSLGMSQERPPRGNGGPPGGGFGGFGGAGKTLGQTGKNIKVLTDAPASQKNAIMDFFTASLGVKCSFCHVVDAEGLKPELDDIGKKKDAREMIQMVMEINSKHFEGRPTVSCYTCHQGSTDPTVTASLPVVAAQERSEAEIEAREKSMPKTDEVLAMYEKALGGADAIGKIKSWNMKATFNRNGDEQHLELVMQSPHKYAGTISMGDRGNMTNVYSEGDGWSMSQMGARPMQDAEKTRLSREAAIVPVLRLKELGKDLRFRGMEQINGKPAYMLIVRMGDSVRERYYIDSASNLLVRRTIYNKSLVGWLPDQADYSDYKAVEGVQMPWTVTYSYTDPRNSTVRKFTEIKANASVDEKLFQKPEMKPMQGKPGGGQ